MDLNDGFYADDFGDEKRRHMKQKKEEKEAKEQAAKREEQREASALLRAADVLDQIEMARDEMREGVLVFDGIMERCTAEFKNTIRESESYLRIATRTAAEAAFNDLDGVLANQKKKIANFDDELQRIQDRLENLREGVSLKIVTAAAAGAVLGGILGAVLGVFLYTWIR